MKIHELVDAKYILDKIGDIPTESDFFPTSNKGEKRLRIDKAEEVYFILPDAMNNRENAYRTSIPESVAVIVTENQNITSELPIIVVENSRAAYATALSRYYGIDYGKTSVIGVTGTNGKTTTASLIYGILKSCEYSVGFIGTGKIEFADSSFCEENYSMTTPDPELLYSSISKMQSLGAEYIVMEVSSHAIALKKIEPICFALCVFTNLSEEHLDFHRDIESYFLSKSELFRKTRRAVINLDDAWGRRLYDTLDCEKHSLGIIESAENRITDIELLGLSGSRYIFRTKDSSFIVKPALIGEFNIYNTATAILSALALGISPRDAKRGVESCGAPSGRMEIINEEITVIIDYAHTPFALKNALKTIKRAKNARQKLYCIFGCGGERDSSKRPAMAEAAALYSDFIIITEDNNRHESFNDILSDIERGIPEGTKYCVLPKREEAIFSAIMQADAGDIVAIIGKGHERYKIVGDEKIPFDERIIVNCALDARRSLKHEN